MPFFSDEAFLWIVRDADGDPQGNAWDKKGIKYDAKEYALYWGKVMELIRRMENEDKGEVWARDVERVGFILGKEREKGTGSKAVVEKSAEKRKMVTEAPAERPVRGISPPPVKRVKHAAPLDGTAAKKKKKTSGVDGSKEPLRRSSRSRK